LSDKAPDAFRNITEVSAQLDVPSHVLRFWETRFNQIKPVKRSGGRRYYRPADITLLTRIRDLLYAEGYTIKGAQQVLKAKSESVSSSGSNSEGGQVSALGLLREASTRLSRLGE
jgi:DNA-binding transcriptional MerR regulator